MRRAYYYCPGDNWYYFYYIRKGPSWRHENIVAAVNIVGVNIVDVNIVDVNINTDVTGDHTTFAADESLRELKADLDTVSSSWTISSLDYRHYYFYIGNYCYHTNCHYWYCYFDCYSCSLFDQLASTITMTDIIRCLFLIFGFYRSLICF